MVGYGEESGKFSSVFHGPVRGRLSDRMKTEIPYYRELMDEFGADGAKLVFALFFGWLYGCVYLLPWLLIYQTLKLLQRRWSVLTGPIMKKKSR